MGNSPAKKSSSDEQSSSSTAKKAAEHKAVEHKAVHSEILSDSKEPLAAHSARAYPTDTAPLLCYSEEEEAKRVRKLSEFPAGVLHSMWEFLPEVERKDLPLVDVAPRVQECHLVFYSGETVRLAESSRRVPPTKTNCGFSVPEKRITYSLQNPVDTATAISSYWMHLHPVKFSVITVVLERDTLVDDIECLKVILNGIKPTLGHARTLMVVLGEVSNCFSIFRGSEYCLAPPAKFCEVNCARMNDCLASIPALCGTSDVTFCMGLLRSFPYVDSSPLASVVIPLHDTETWEWYCTSIWRRRDWPDPRLHLMVVNPDKGGFWEKDYKMDSLRHVSYFYYEGWSDLFRHPPTLDFSSSSRLISLIFTSGFQVNAVILPVDPSKLEQLVLNLSYYRGVPLMAAGSPTLDRLQHLVLPLPKGTTSISSEMLPALRQLEAPYCFLGASLDLSKFTKPGLSLSLTECGGPVKFPPADVPLSMATFDMKSFSADVSKAAPTLPSLKVFIQGRDDVGEFLRIMKGEESPTPERPVVPILKKLSLHSRFHINFGTFTLFSQLLYLDLRMIDAIIRGDLFPNLLELKAHDCQASFTQNFASLQSLFLTILRGSAFPDFGAPNLRELTLLDVDTAVTLPVSKTAFPKIQAVTIGQFYSSCSDAKALEPFVPKLSPDVGADEGPKVVLRYDCRYSADFSKQLRDLVPTWLAIPFDPMQYTN